MDTLADLLKLFGVGILSSILSFYIAKRGHMDKKWWELRVASYQAVIEALSDLNHYYDSLLTAELVRREISEERASELRKMSHDGYNRVRKAADSGVFLFSEEVSDALTDFIKSQAEDSESYFEFLDASSAAAEKCLRIVVTLAKRDLRVRPTWF